MRAFDIAMLALAAVITVSTFGVWLATDRHGYTKFEVVEQVTVENSGDDIFADTGLFGNEDKRLETRTRDEFHLGLLPTPQGIFDKHAVSVMTIVGPVWAICLGAIFIRRRKANRAANLKTKDQTQSIAT